MKKKGERFAQLLFLYNIAPKQIEIASEEGALQELRRHKHRPTKIEEVNPFSGVCFCADCGRKMYLCRAKSLTADQEHLKCGTYAKEKVNIFISE